jgi:hypothetical protein
MFTQKEINQKLNKLLTTKTHFIYPYISPKDFTYFGFELRYSLRSIYKYYKDDFDITIIGDLPEWLDTSKVNFIKYYNQDKFYSTQAKIFDSMLQWIPNVEDFVQMNDDFHLLRPVTKKDFSYPRYISKLYYSEVLDPSLTRFQRNIRNTYFRLKELNKSYDLNYSTHVPLLFNTDMTINLIEPFNLLNNKDEENHLFEGAYYQYYNIPGIPVGNYRAGFWTKENNIEQLKYATILNYDEFGFIHNQWILDFLKEKFPEKCEAEL